MCVCVRVYDKHVHKYKWNGIERKTVISYDIELRNLIYE